MAASRDLIRRLGRRSRMGMIACLFVGVVVSVGPASGQTPDNAQLERAVRAYEEGRIQVSRSSLDSVSVDLLTDRDASIYHLYSGFIDLVFGRDQAARQHFRASVRLDSDVRPDPSLVAPGRLTIYREERQAEQQSQERLVSLRIDPDSVTLTMTDSIQFGVSGRRDDGSRVRSPQVSFRVMPASAGRIGPEGWFVPEEVDRDARSLAVQVMAEAQAIADTAQVLIAIGEDTDENSAQTLNEDERRRRELIDSLYRLTAVCQRALRNTNVELIERFFSARTDRERDNLEALLTLLMRDELGLEIVRIRNDRESRRVSPSIARERFDAHLEWRSSFGGGREEWIEVEATASESEDGSIRMLCTVSGNPDLS